MGIFQKKDNISLEEFRDYWHYNHGAIASKMSGLLKYDQNHTVRSLNFAMARAQSQFWVDGYSKLWFGDRESQKNNDPETITRLRADEVHLFAYEVLIVAEEQVTIAMDPDAGFVKLIAFARRAPEIDADTFKKEWWGDHATLIKKMPGIIGCTQNWVFERIMVDVDDEYKRVPASYEELPIDGILEMCFRNVPEMEAAFESPEGQKICEHARTFIADIGSQLTNQYRIFKK